MHWISNNFATFSSYTCSECVFVFLSVAELGNKLLCKTKYSVWGNICLIVIYPDSLVAQTVKNLPTILVTQI